MDLLTVCRIFRDERLETSAGGRGSARRRVLWELLVEFVRSHTSKSGEQRSADWYSSLGATIGGSELSAIMGLSEYKSFNDVVIEKAAHLRGAARRWAGNAACNWGIIMEDVITPCVEIDLMGDIIGDTICIKMYEGHRNSPDGYIIVMLAVNDVSGSRRIITHDDSPMLLDDEHIEEHIALIEFKNPLSRKPDGSVPDNYLPQVLSGLMVSPIAHLGIFIDSVIRKCSSLSELGPNPGYDTIYHAYDDGRYIGRAPYMWGVIAVYAPTAPGDAAHEFTWGTMRPQLVLGKFKPHDIGTFSKNTYNYVMDLMATNKLKYKVPQPSTQLGAEDYTECCTTALDGFKLWGFIPWKVLEINYVPVDPQPNFHNVALPLIREVLMRAKKLADDMNAAAVSEEPAADDSLLGGLTADDLEFG